MNTPLTPPKVLFDELFGQLLEFAAKHEELKATKRLSAELVDAKDRLHSLRSQMSTARCLLTNETGVQVCSRQPTNRSKAAKSASRSVEHPNQLSEIGQT